MGWRLLTLTRVRGEAKKIPGGSPVPMHSFAPKALRHVRFGFAAGCEAGALPRQQPPDNSRATPLVRAWPIGSIRPRPYKGIAQKVKGTSTAVHSHRREANSGGKAEAERSTQDF